MKQQQLACHNCVAVTPCSGSILQEGPKKYLAFLIREFQICYSFLKMQMFPNAGRGHMMWRK
jgi:hypothetical protein